MVGVFVGVAFGGSDCCGRSGCRVRLIQRSGVIHHPGHQCWEPGRGCCH